MTDEEKKIEETTTEEKTTEEKVVKETTVEEKKAPEKIVAKQGKYLRTAKGRKRLAAKTPRGKAFIHSSVNNTIVTITDPNGNTLTWASAGHCGFRGPKKATPYAASKIIDKIAEQTEKFGVKDLHVVVTGIGSGRDSAIRSLNAKGFNILSITERTPVPNNGCRPKRPRRV